jgi:DNA-binding transcriptional LysR family regulator
MNIDALAIFAEVLEAGSFAAAARRRALDPSVISRVIAALEEELGFRLFQRTTRRLAPTEAGAVYFERIRGLVEDLDRARAEARDRVAGRSGNLRVTASASFGLSCIVPTIAAFKRRYPDLSLDVRLTDNVVDLVGERIDVAFRLGPRPEGDFICARLMTTRYRVCAAPAWRATAQATSQSCRVRTNRLVRQAHQIRPKGTTLLSTSCPMSARPR